MTIDKKKDLNFKTIWIRYDASSSDRHQLFIKEHSIRNQEPEYPKGKTLFVLNIPPYATFESVKKAFGDTCGSVKNITFIPDSNVGFKNAYIVFAKEVALKKALALNSESTLTLNSSDLQVLTGVQKWYKQYNDSIQSESKLQEIIDKCLMKYDDRKDEETEESSVTRKHGKGWITVSGKKKRGKFATSRKESTIQKIQTKEEQKKHKKQLLNFYTFQIREAKKENLAELRKKFELDKKKLEQIKTKRIFKPF